MNGAIYRQYVQQMLAPILTPGDVVVLDNLPAHRVAGVRHLIEARGASLLFLPIYSPDLNPIELMFAKLKSLLRSAGARTIERLWTDLGTCLAQFSARNARDMSDTPATDRRGETGLSLRRGQWRPDRRLRSA